jgi:hypothetical protein
MPISIDTLKAIIAAGGGFEIDAQFHDPAELVGIVGPMDTTAVLRVRNPTAWTQDQMVSVAQSAPPGVVAFIF